MSSKTTFAKLKPDLRSPLFARLRRGIAIGWSRILTLLVIDSILISLAWRLAIFKGTNVTSPWTDDNGTRFLPLILVVELSIFATRSLYKAGQHRRDYIGLLKAISLANILLLLIAFLYEPSSYISRSTFLFFWFLNATFICLGRVFFDVFTNLVRDKGIIRHTAFLISDDEDRESNIGLIEGENCYRLLGVAGPAALDRANREATFDSLCNLGIEEVFVSWNAIKNRLHLCWRFQTNGMTLRILQAQGQQAFLSKTEFLMIGQHSCLTVPTPVLIGGEYWVKRCFDFFFSVVLLLILSPVLIIIAVLVKLDSPGGIFFRQTRIGLHNREFKVWKFRTMVQNADKLQAELERKNEMKDGVLFKMKSDPRITRVGAVLRRYSLDELPQLFNVLLGEMSFVGPRPLPIRDVERFKENYFIRQEVLPGITGLWQVSGRSNIDNFEDAVRLDLTYIANWSIWMDLEIMLKTVKVVLFKTGAY